MFKNIYHLVANGWIHRSSKKHGLLTHPMGIGRTTVPGSRSDRRDFYNFRGDIQRIEGLVNKQDDQGGGL